MNVRDEDGQTPFHHATRYAPKGTALNPTQVAYVPMRPDDNRRDDDKEDEEDEEEEEANQMEEEEGEEAEAAEEDQDVLQV